MATTNKYTPTTEDVRETYYDAPGMQRPKFDGKEFDRWLAGELDAARAEQRKVDAQIAARQDYGSRVQPESPEADARARAIAAAIRGAVQS